MTDIYVIGGEIRQTMFRKLAEWQSSQEGVIVQLNLENKTSHPCVNYISPPEVCAADLPAVTFKAASVAADKLYACTSTEVLVYEVPGFRLIHYISLPCFNDLHHVCPTPEGNLLVAVTGLDMPIFPKRRFQHGAVSETTMHSALPFREAEYRRKFLSLYS